MLHDRRAALDPVAAVVVRDPAHLARRRGVDMATQHRIHRIAPRVPDDLVLESPDKTHHVLHFTLHIRAQRPMRPTSQRADRIDHPVHIHQQLVTDVSQVRQPAHALHHHVQLMAVDHEDPPAIHRPMDRALLDRHAPECPKKMAHELVVVPRNVYQARALAPLPQQFLDDVVVLLRPEYSPPQRPYVNDVAHQIQRLELIVLQEPQQRHRIAATRPQMHIRNKPSTIMRHAQHLSWPAIRRLFSSCSQAIHTG